MVYYNEFDRHAAQWLRELIAENLIPEGVVDDRSIVDVEPVDLAEFSQCHFFAGIGGWPHALDLAGWNPTRPVWTASLPCQPFSAAGKRKGGEDERHLWPVFYRLVEKCRPSIIFGEQVASADGRNWLAAVFADLELLGYAVAGADLCAASVGAPHIRQRLYWCAVRVCDPGGGLPDSMHSQRREVSKHGENGPHREDNEREETYGFFGAHSKVCGSWDDVVYVPCADGKARPIKPSIKPLADGIPPDLVRGSDTRTPDAENSSEARVMRLRGYGNAIVPQVASIFVKSVMDLDLP